MWRGVYRPLDAGSCKDTRAGEGKSRLARVEDALVSPGRGVNEGYADYLSGFWFARCGRHSRRESHFRRLERIIRLRGSMNHNAVSHMQISELRGLGNLVSADDDVGRSGHKFHIDGSLRRFHRHLIRAHFFNGSDHMFL